MNYPSNLATENVIAFGPMDALEDDLLASWRAVTQATYQFLTLLREFDLRQGWHAYGNADCAEWLNWRCGISRTTAQEKVRVANALWTLPQIDEAFRRGDLSYSKVRALTRVAGEATETELLEFALDASAAQLETYCRRLRNGDATTSITDARRIREGRSLTRHFHDDGTGTLSVDLPREELELVLKALEQVSTTLPEESTPSLFARGADALVQMAKATLAPDPDSAGSTADLYQVVVHVDASALEGQGGEADLPSPTVRRLCCDGAVTPLIQNTDGTPLNVGRKRRVVPTAIRRAVDARDRHCTFPGCHHDQWLEYHHIEHWADGGETSLENLTLLCSHHHTLLHEQGFRLRQRRDGSHFFARPDGRPVEVPGDIADEQDEVDQVREVRASYRARCVVSSSAEDGWGMAASATQHGAF